MKTNAPPHTTLGWAPQGQEWMVCCCIPWVLMKYLVCFLLQFLEPENAAHFAIVNGRIGKLTIANATKAHNKFWPYRNSGKHISWDATRKSRVRNMFEMLSNQPDFANAESAHVLGRVQMSLHTMSKTWALATDICYIFSGNYRKTGMDFWQC